MTRFGLDCFLENFPAALKGKRIGVVCHAASVTSAYSHITDVLAKHPSCKLSAIFGPQHGLFGQTQDNMIEWESAVHPVLNIPVYSLYGSTRKPTSKMLDGLDALVFDIQDVGARPYTYIWTLKLCMEACAEKNISVWVLDRPNPVGCVPVDGYMLSPQYFTFVGGAEIPLCHRLTMGEMARIIQKKYHPSCELETVKMDGWWRDSYWPETRLPWVLPSPNMPFWETAAVYPGMVLFEATNVSEGRGTTRPFELFGAPYIDFEKFKKELFSYELGGCIFREHGFIPTFQKWQGKFCYGMQIHVTNPRSFYPVKTAAAIIASIMKSSDGEFAFKNPPYEYEQIKMPFDILSGDDRLRKALVAQTPLEEIVSDWQKGYGEFNELFSQIALYPERL